MGLIENYINEIKNTFVSHHLYFFIVAIIIFQILDRYVVNHYPIKIYQVATFLSFYLFVNTPYSSYTLIMGGIIASFLSYYIYKIFVYFNMSKKIFILNIVTFTSILSCMIICNCVAMPALAYTLMSYKTIPSSPTSYLYSFIIATIFIIIISFLLVNILSFINTNILNIEQYNVNFKQIKENLSNWNFMPASSNIVTQPIYKQPNYDQLIDNPFYNQ